MPSSFSDPAPPPYPAGWPAGTLHSAAIGEAGLVLGAGTVLAPMGKGRTLALDPERVLALLSVAAGRPLPVRALEGIASAASHWRRGDAALANLRLVFAGLPRLEEPVALHRLQAADWLLRNGLMPRALMRELGLDASALDAARAGDLGKYNPAQPRVPAGNGIESGRWSDVAAQAATPPGTSAAKPSSGSTGSSRHPVEYASSEGLPPDGLVSIVTCGEHIAAHCKGSVLREFPSQFLNMQLEDLLAAARSGDPAARRAKKLMFDKRFQKP